MIELISTGGLYSYEEKLIYLEIKGEKILNITSGDPVLHGFANDEINEYLIKAVEDGWNMYSASSTKNEARKAIAEFEKKTGGGTYSPGNILFR